MVHLDLIQEDFKVVEFAFKVGEFTQPLKKHIIPQFITNIQQL